MSKQNEKLISLLEDATAQVYNGYRMASSQKNAKLVTELEHITESLFGIVNQLEAQQ